MSSIIVPKAVTTTIKAWAATSKDAPLSEWEYTPRPLGDDDVEIAISHCGICGSDLHTIRSGWMQTVYPCVVGHEIVGHVSAAGPKALATHPIGLRVGVGAACHACLEDSCEACSSGFDNLCPQLKWTYHSKYADGIMSQGGYASHVRVQKQWAFELPKELPSEIAAPLLCAGVTTFAPLKRYGVAHGKKVGIVGIGGLGHLAVQFAAKMGAEVTAISFSPSKKAEAAKLGAHHFVALSDADAVAAAARTLDFLLITSFDTTTMLDSLLAFLNINGEACFVGLPEEPIRMSVFGLTAKQVKVGGSCIGSTGDVKEMLEFAAKHDVRPWIEVMPMDKVNEAVQKVQAGKPRFRIVLENRAHEE
ncbi:chaperonin 10-like protein [Blyttiomyces helicus]|uniref:Chaperonin 10-like protein n=1 Tax=Blyttiomyces helicus TaxID=388810 RepID=A0A4P9W119_9FUNG|nr:chaperonin 10-like protein [Blyttiomyces helicus]|eukprot:RKO85859.1 chaperonin 10-like protein [Blyttiomyces helicus]